MIIQCQGCNAKYFLSSDKVPPKPVRVRCPKCKAVFRLDPSASSKAENLVAQAVQDVISSPVSPQGGETQQAVPGKESALGTEPREREAREKPSRPAGRKEERAKRLARVLVSDILWYNKEKRDQALLDGNLIAALGEEIKKSWELYKEKVGPDLANSTSYFKEALNEILADGQKIF